MVTSFEFSKHGLVIGLPGGGEMEKDPGQLVSGVLDGLQWAEACALGPVVIAQVGLVVVKALSRHAECLGHAIFGFRLRPANASTGACAVFGTEIEPRIETVIVWKLGGQIGAEFTEDGLNAEGIEAGDESEIDTKDAFQMIAEIET